MERRRAIRAAVVSAAFGLAATLGGAWGAWFFLDWQAGERTVVRSMHLAVRSVEDAAPFIWRWSQPGCEAWYVSRAPGDPTEGALEEVLPRWTGMWARDWRVRGGVGSERAVVAYGWPRVAMMSRLGERPGAEVRRGPFPWRPAWPGFVQNVALFGGGLWAVAFLPRAWLRWVRRAQGVCPECGYDLRGEFGRGCSECGWGRG